MTSSEIAPVDRRSLWISLAFTAVLALGVRLGYLFSRRAFGDVRIQPYHIESAALFFVICGLCLRFVRGKAAPTRLTRVPAPGPLAWALWCCGAVALYWPALFVGLLSDDFILIQHASAWNVGSVTREFFRPAALFVWAVLLRAHAGPVTLHLLNVVLHGTNSYLSTRVVEGWLPGRRWGILAGLVVLTMPLAPEAVVWCSGVFDVMATTLVLASVLIARRYATEASPGTRGLLVLVSVMALLSKETAAIGPAIVLVDGSLRRALPRTLVLDLSALLCLFGLVSVLRLASSVEMHAVSLSRFALQHALFASFGSLAAPWHSDVARASPMVPVLAGWTVIGLVAVFLLHAGTADRTRNAIAGSAWILIPIVPAFPFFFVGPDLQGSRYLYLSVLGWAAVIVTAAADMCAGRPRLARPAFLAVLVIAALGAYGTRIHLRPWVDAGALRDAAERAALDNPRVRSCPQIVVEGLPDSVRGAYVFRTGAREAFAALGLNLSVGPAGGPCSFRWDENRLAFIPSGRI